MVGGLSFWVSNPAVGLEITSTSFAEPGWSRSEQTNAKSLWDRSAIPAFTTWDEWAARNNKVKNW